MTDNGKPYSVFVDEKTGAKCFKTSTGVVLDLGAGIPPAIYKYFGAMQTNAKPDVPMIEKKAGKRTVLAADAKNPEYRSELNFWALKMMNATNEFVFSYIRTQPPDDYQVPEFLIQEGEEITPQKRKVLWIMGLLMSDDESDECANALITITMPDEEEVVALQDTTFPSRSDAKRTDGISDEVQL